MHQNSYYIGGLFDIRYNACLSKLLSSNHTRVSSGLGPWCINS